MNLWIKFYGVTIQMKPLQQYFDLGTIYLVCSSNSFESVDQILWCYHSDETSSAVLSHGTVKLVCSSNLLIIFFRIMITLIKYLFSSISEILA